MNTATRSLTEPTSVAQKLLISDAQAISAWAERMDEAAGRWLCEKYRPLCIAIAAQYLSSPTERKMAADASLREALIILAGEGFMTSAARCIAQVTIRTCTARSREDSTDSQQGSSPLLVVGQEPSFQLAA